MKDSEKERDAERESEEVIEADEVELRDRKRMM